ncbi:cellulose binding domain-containing protein [Dactylosporangium sp. NPDC051541]|uniref:cellulose binding domain-containing protein n=1 Tax=Dactylosporangium sp. NPDC051541 TaxID=3363977 RepID=UPI0037AE81EF
MRGRIRFGAIRTATICAVAAMLAGAALVMFNPGVSAADASTKYLGIFRQTSPAEIPSGTASRYGVTPASALWFDSWGTGNAFNAAEAKTLWNQGIMLHYTWEPWNTSLSVSDPAQIHLQDIVNGKWDSYIRARGAEFAAAGAPIMVRWGHEFNGNWYPWGIVNNNSDPTLYVNAYRRVHDLVVAAGATNVQWIWCFNNSSTPSAAYNDPARSYPGDAYVDWVGIDGYNWGLGPSWDPSGNYWTSFDSMFAGPYSQARSIAPRRPVMIGEVASTEDGGSKSQWINDMSAALQSSRYVDLKAIYYFDQDKEEPWSGTSSSGAQAAFRTWVNQPYMRGTGTELAKVAPSYRGTNPSTPPVSSPPVSSPPASSRPPSSPPPVSSQPPTGACTATYRTVNAWSGGFQGEVTVQAGTAAINGWTVRWTLGGGQSVSQLWNGTLSASGTAVSVRNVSWNAALPTNGTATFGFLAGGSPNTPALTCTSP